MTVAVYPGTFDPITLGHIDVAMRSARLFDEVVIAVYRDAMKPGRMFDADERIALARESLADIAATSIDLRQCADRISVEGFTGLVVEYAKDRRANVIVRGLRAVSDFEYEFKLAHMNQHLAPDIEVVCLMTDSRHAFVSSSLIREVGSLGGDVSGLVPDNVRSALMERFNPRSAAPPQPLRTGQRGA